MELFLIRHGQSTNNALTDWTLRVEDPPLTTAANTRHSAPRSRRRRAPPASGRARNDATGARPAVLQPDDPRDADGRSIGGLGVAPEVWVDIHEVGGIYLDHGERKVGYPGRTRSELAQAVPAVHPDARTDRKRLVEPRLRRSARRPRPRGERRPGLRERAGDDTRVGLVSHGDFLSALLKALGGQAADSGMYYEHRNTGITCVDLTPQGARVRYLNRVDHLDDEALITY